MRRRYALVLQTWFVLGAWCDLAAEVFKAAGNLARRTGEGYLKTWERGE